MKRLFALLVLIGLAAGLYWYLQPPAPETAAHVPRLAKHGTFFLTEYVSVPTPNGVIGFEPGREVRFVRADRAKGLLIVTDGKYEAELPPGKLTNDLDAADLARKGDEDSQRQLAAFLAAQKAAYDRTTKATDIKYAQEIDRVTHGPKADPYSYLGH